MIIARSSITRSNLRLIYGINIIIQCKLIYLQLVNIVTYTVIIGNHITCENAPITIIT